MTKTNYIVRTVNGTKFGFKATRVIVENNNYSQKVYEFGTDRFGSGDRVMVKVWDKAQNKMVVRKLAHCVMVEALVINLETKEEFTWNGKVKYIG